MVEVAVSLAAATAAGAALLVAGVLRAASAPTEGAVAAPMVVRVAMVAPTAVEVVMGAMAAAAGCRANRH